MPLLVDPLAAFFRPALASVAPLVLSATDVEITLLPPLARLAVTRRFTNSTDTLIEAVLTLPPPAMGEVVYGLTVTINGTPYRAKSLPRARARRLHEAAVLEGRRGILHELLLGGAQLIAIAGIEAGADVAVRIDSIRPLDRQPDCDDATLSVKLTADPRPINRRLSEFDQMMISAYVHGATLAVITNGAAVVLREPDRQITSGASVPVDCAASVTLSIAATDIQRLDCSECNAASPGGWKTVSVPSSQSLAGGPLPDAAVVGTRTDWIFGCSNAEGSEIRVVAPYPDAALTADVSAVSAFAANALIASALRHEPAVVRRAANILGTTTPLLFIGADGELPDEIPILRKLALPDIAAADDGFESLGSFTEPEAEPEADAVPLPAKLRAPLPEAPGTGPEARRPLYLWLIWAPALLALLWVLGALRFAQVPLRPVLGLFVVLLLLNALRFRPHAGSPARRRLPLLACLVLPWLASLAVGPVGLVEVSWQATERERMVAFQAGLLIASAVLPLLLLPAMRGGRAFTIIVGILNFVVTFLATSVAMIANMPGD